AQTRSDQLVRARARSARPIVSARRKCPQKSRASMAVAARSASRGLRLGAKTVETAKARANNGAIRIRSDATAAHALPTELAPAARHASITTNAAAAVAAITMAPIESTRQNRGYGLRKKRAAPVGR